MYKRQVNGQLGEKGARDINEILEANRALFAGGELDEEAKDAFYQAVTLSLIHIYTCHSFCQCFVPLSNFVSLLYLKKVNPSVILLHKNLP